MSVDSQVLAGVKNRVGKWELVSELHRIEREEKAEMRMHNTAKQRFKAKYYKLEQFLDRGRDAADVRMYETHNPGFCFRRNGECRTPQTPLPSPSVDYDDIYNLLFTDGEVDIEKVLCLHLLTAHKTETLTPPPKINSHSFIAKNQSPLERLIERSRKKRQEDSVTKLLPTYILELNTSKPGENSKKKDNEIVIRDGRLAARIIINDKIVQLVHIVMAALQHTNTAKMNSLLEMASKVEAIKQVIEKPHILEFLGTLNGQTLICSCESFHLTQPFKAVTIPLELEMKSNNPLAKLLQYIRKNILQSPSQAIKCKTVKEESIPELSAALKNSKKPKDTSSISSRTTLSLNEHSDTQQTNMSKKSANKNKDTNISPSTSSRGARATTGKKKVETKTSGSSKNNTMTSLYPSFLSYLEEDKNTKRKNESTLSINKKSEDTKSSKKSEKSENSEITSMIDQNDNIFKMMDIRAVATLINNKALAAHKRDLDELNEEQENVEQPTQVVPKPQTEPAKVSIKQMNCQACLQKWKTPLPTPKTPKIKKMPVLKTDQISFNEFKTGSAQRLSLMIDEEMKKLNAERQAPNVKNYSFRDYKKKGSLASKQMVDTVDMDALDLAKITQEIKEKETQKKLTKFLANKI